MKERPILMSGDMVKATLEGKKTQTRRIVKLPSHLSPCHFNSVGDNVWSYYTGRDAMDVGRGFVNCPYGQLGDRLWVRETYYRYGKWVKAGITRTNKQSWEFKALKEDVRYTGNEPSKLIDSGYTGWNTTPREIVESNDYRKEGWYKKPSIHMPRWASRILLEILDIRVERIQDITEEDAKKEGVIPHIVEHQTTTGKPLKSSYLYIRQFRELWNSLNTKRGYGWDKNNWVWVIIYKLLNNS